MTSRETTALETPSTLVFGQATPLRPQTSLQPHGSNQPVLRPSVALLEFRIQPWRLLAASIALCVVLAVVTIALMHGFELDTVAPGESLSWYLLRSHNISDQIDELNSYSGNAASVLGALSTFVLQLIIYVLILALIPALMVDNSSTRAKLALFAITGGVSWLASQGFVATNVQLKSMETIPVLSFADLNGFDRDTMTNYQNFTPFVSDAIANPQSSTSTLLRSAISGTYPREAVACSVFPEGDHFVSVSFGFSSAEWLRYVLPNGCSDTTTSARFPMNASVAADESLPMSQGNATLLAIFALDMTNSFFAAQVRSNVGTMNTTSYESLWVQFSEQADNTDQTDDTFLSAFQQLMRSTFSDEKNYFQHFSTKESSAEFTRTQLSDQITFDALTLEIPLKRNFFSRTLTANLTNMSSSSNLMYTSTTVEVADDEDAVYEMAVWEDCTPNGCMLTGGLGEVNSNDVVVYPEDQVLAVQICLDADGNEDPPATLDEGCQYGYSPNSFLVFSVASRIEGESMNIDSQDESMDRRRRLEFESMAYYTKASQEGSWPGAADDDCSASSIVSSGSSANEIDEADALNRLRLSIDSSSSTSVDSLQVPDHEIPGGDATNTTARSQTLRPSITISDTVTPTESPATDPPVIIVVPTTRPPKTKTPKITAAKEFSFSAKASKSTTAVADNTTSADSASPPARTTSSYTLSADATADFVADLTRKAYLKNCRKIYTITVGRISWTLEDLAARFGARCNITYNNDCQGLTFELTNSSKRLVVGKQYLPLRTLREYSDLFYLWTPLAKLKRDVSSQFRGDFAFKKAFAESNWPDDLSGESCKSSREEYIVSALDNHLYSQHSFQPAYTASVMWLFQYGTANEIIDLDQSSRQSLAFASNIVRNRVVMSTPWNSAYFTIAVCALVLVLALVVSSMVLQQRGVWPARVVRTRTVAEVLLMEDQYPPLFVTSYIHPSEQQQRNTVTDVASAVTVVADTTEQPLHSYNLLGLELRSNVDDQWLSDRPKDLNDA